MSTNIITIILLQSKTAGAACHEEVCQCTARWMSSTPKNVIEMAVREHAGSEGETSCTSVWREEPLAAVGATRHGDDGLNMRNVFRTIPRREGDVA